MQINEFIQHFLWFCVLTSTKDDMIWPSPYSKKLSIASSCSDNPVITRTHAFNVSGLTLARPYSQKERFYIAIVMCGDSNFEQL